MFVTYRNNTEHNPPPVKAALRSQFLLFLAMLGCLCGIGHVLSARPATQGIRASKSSHRAVVGAIRWDAWFGDQPDTTVGREVERSLGPSQWHSRLPFFAKEISPTAVQVRSNIQSVMDEEIRYAHQ